MKHAKLIGIIALSLLSVALAVAAYLLLVEVETLREELEDARGDWERLAVETTQEWAACEEESQDDHARWFDVYQEMAEDLQTCEAHLDLQHGEIEQWRAE